MNVLESGVDVRGDDFKVRPTRAGGVPRVRRRRDARAHLRAPSAAAAQLGGDGKAGARTEDAHRHRPPRRRRQGDGAAHRAWQARRARPHRWCVRPCSSGRRRAVRGLGSVHRWDAHALLTSANPRLPVAQHCWMRARHSSSCRRSRGICSTTTPCRPAASSRASGACTGEPGRGRSREPGGPDGECVRGQWWWTARPHPAFPHPPRQAGGHDCSE